MRLSQRRRDQVHKYWPLALFAAWVTLIVITAILTFR